MKYTLRTFIIGMLSSPGSLDIARRVYDTDYICPCLPAHASDTVPKIIIRCADDKIKQ